MNIAKGKGTESKRVKGNDTRGRGGILKNIWTTKKNMRGRKNKTKRNASTA